MSAFHEILFPLEVGFGATGGPERRTDVVTLASGYEERNARWASSRRRYDAGLGARSLQNLQTILAFFEERRGRLYGFRFRDPFDHASCTISQTPSATDQAIGTGDGTTKSYQLKKAYGGTTDPYQREISKPVSGTVVVALDGVETLAFQLDATSGLLTLDTAPADGTLITCGYLFDVPVRFDADRLEFSLSAFEAGNIPSIPLVEIRS